MDYLQVFNDLLSLWGHGKLMTQQARQLYTTTAMQHCTSSMQHELQTSPLNYRSYFYQCKEAFFESIHHKD